MLVPFEHEVAPEWELGQGRSLVNDAAHVGDPGQRDHPKRARIRNRRGESRVRGRSHRSLDDRPIDAEQFAYRGAHQVFSFAFANWGTRRNVS